MFFLICSSASSFLSAIILSSSSGELSSIFLTCLKLLAKFVSLVLCSTFCSCFGSTLVTFIFFGKVTYRAEATVIEFDK